MLYVFHVDTGTMLTFDMNVAMQRSVSLSSASRLFAVIVCTNYMQAVFSEADVHSFIHIRQYESLKSCLIIKLESVSVVSLGGSTKSWRRRRKS